MTRQRNYLGPPNGHAAQQCATWRIQTHKFACNTCGRATLAVSATATTQLSDTGAVHTVPEETVTVDTTVAMADACEVGVGLWVGAIVGTLDGIAVG